MCSPQRLLLLLQDKDKELEELLQEIQCEKVPSLTVVPWVECILELETQVQILALSFSPSLQRLKQRQHPNSPSLWNLCVGICRHNFGAKRQRIVASACRSRYLLAPQVGKEGQGPGRPRVVAYQVITFRKAFPQSIMGYLLPKTLCFRETRGRGQEQEALVLSSAVTALGSASQSLHPLGPQFSCYPWGGDGLKCCLHL